MTAAQEDAAEKIKEIMREHFDLGLCALVAIDEQVPERDRRYLWHGGIEAAVGLASMAHDAIIYLDQQHNV